MTEVLPAQEDCVQAEPMYSPGRIEARWQNAWREAGMFATPGAEDKRRSAHVFADCPLSADGVSLEAIRSYAIADAYARFMRMNDRAVLFSVGFDAFRPEVEAAARRLDMSPSKLVDLGCERTRAQFDLLGISCDWKRKYVTTEPGHYRWSQWLFLRLLEHDLVYETDGRWRMRTSGHVDENMRALESLTGWTEAAIELQRAALGRIDGVELQAGTFDGISLVVFTPYADAIDKAAFVAVSPADPQASRWIEDPALTERLADLPDVDKLDGDSPTERAPFVLTEAFATVPGVAGMLPIIVSPLVDTRFGSTTVLGVPELDATDRVIAEYLPAPAGAAWKTSSSGAAAQPAVRYRATDPEISCTRAWGPPMPLVHCADCGIVPVSLEDLPVCLPSDLRVATEGTINPLAERADFYGCNCPRCGADARRDTDTIAPHMEEMWTWMSLCVPPERRASAMFDDPEYARWLPAYTVVAGASAASRLFDRRLFAKMLRAVGALHPLADDEPFSNALVHESVCCEQDTTDEHLDDLTRLDELLARDGGDTVRLALLYAASPGRSLRWGDQPLRDCHRFLRALYEYAEPRLQDWADQGCTQAKIDSSDRLRRRLAHWCETAYERVTAQLSCGEMQRAVLSVMRLFTRVRDFELRALQRRGDVDAADREAIVAALLLLTRLLAPLAPHLAEELWARANQSTSVGDQPWPRVERSGSRQNGA
jgi:leucyl-tRNA synthetase